MACYRVTFTFTFLLRVCYTQIAPLSILNLRVSSWSCVRIVPFNRPRQLISSSYTHTHTHAHNEPLSSYSDGKSLINPLTPNEHYSGRTAPLTFKRCILYIYSTNTDTVYFKHAIYSPFFSLQNAVCFIILKYFVPVLFTFYIQGVLKLKK
jgi:hypothetical protein